MKLPTQNALFKKITEFTRNNPEFEFTLTPSLLARDKFPFCKSQYMRSIVESDEHEKRIADYKCPLFYVSTGKGLVKVYTFTTNDKKREEMYKKIAKAQLEGLI